MDKDLINNEDVKSNKQIVPIKIIKCFSLFNPEKVYILKRKGRIAIITFHSLEDRIVKNFIKKQSELSGQLKIITKKPVIPSPHEVEINSRSRSAKLRVAEKI